MTQREQINIDGRIYLRGDLVGRIFGWSRQNVSAIAKREKWQKYRDYHSYYLLSDVNRYKLDREHTIQAKERGLWHRRGLLRHGIAACPICCKSEG